MTFKQKITEEPTREEQLRALQAQVDEIFTEAISNKLTLGDFAIQIWANAVKEEAPYITIASLMINQATGLTGDDNLAFLRFLAQETLAQNVAKVQWAVQLIYDGLVINNRPKDTKNQEVKVELVAANFVTVNSSF